MARLPLMLATTLVAALTACGSQLSPSEVARANGVGTQVGAPGDPLLNGGDTSQPGASVTAADIPDAANAASGSSGAGAGGARQQGGGNASAGSGGTAGGAKAAGAGKGGSCDGFKNQVGITDKEITISNVADIGGPVPGVMESAQQAVRAYIEYFKFQGGKICGRNLSLQLLDSRTDAGADQAAYVRACDTTFAAVGSMSGFDSGGAGAAEKCGLPDIRVTQSSPERQRCSTCFGTFPTKTNLVPLATANVLAQRHPEGAKNAAMFYINGGGAIPNAQSYVKAYESAGWNFSMVQSHDAAEFNYAPYVQQMKQKGVKGVIYFGHYSWVVKIQRAMEQQNYKPDFFLMEGQLYDQRLVDAAGAGGDGTYTFMAFDTFENKANKEMQLYLSWLQQVKPGAIPNVWGVFAWSSARLFVERTTALGGKLTRASLVDEFAKTTAWTSNGMHTAMNVGKGLTPPCFKVLRLQSGKWSQVSSGSYQCGKVVDTGIG